MKNFLTKLSILGLSLMFAVTAYSDTKWFYNPDRVGEGMILSELADGRIAFAFYSHVEDGATIPPSVSPAPPPSAFCDRFTVWFTGLSTEVDKDSATGDIFYDDAINDLIILFQGLKKSTKRLNGFNFYE